MDYDYGDDLKKIVKQLERIAEALEKIAAYTERHAPRFR